MPNDDVIDDVLSSNAQLRKNLDTIWVASLFMKVSYWGIDRLPLLEKRLKNLGLKRMMGQM